MAEPEYNTSGPQSCVLLTVHFNIAAGIHNPSASFNDKHLEGQSRNRMYFKLKERTSWKRTH